MSLRILGLDGGGTRSRAVVADETGQVLDRIEGGALDPTAGDGWEARLRDLAARVGPVDGACLGLPCQGELPDVSARQAALARDLFGSGAEVANDVAVAFDGALRGAEGVLILAGTGSMAWGRGPGGEHRVGGWGDAFGDEGSAHWIGRAALGRLSWHLDGRRPDPAFADGLLASLGLAADGLHPWVYGPADGRRARVASVAAAVSRLGAEGDATAQQLLVEAGRALAEQGQTVARACGLAAPPRWSLAGGVMADPVVRAALAAGMGSDPVPPALPPVGGALLRAARRLRATDVATDMSPDWPARLRDQLGIPA